MTSGKYLSCQVTVNNEIAYVAAWDALYRYLLSSEMELSDQGYVIDIIHNPEDLEDELSDLTLCLPFKA